MKAIIWALLAVLIVSGCTGGPEIQPEATQPEATTPSTEGPTIEEETKSASESDEKIEVDITTVSNSIGPNKLGVKAEDLRSMENPKGEGTFVYVTKTSFSGVKRNIIWLVIDGQAFPLNGATKDITPSLLWPREAPEETWDRTGLSPYTATEAIEIVFGSQ